MTRRGHRAAGRARCPASVQPATCSTTATSPSALGRSRRALLPVARLLDAGVTGLRLRRARRSPRPVDRDGGGSAPVARTTAPPGTPRRPSAPPRRSPRAWPAGTRSAWADAPTSCCSTAIRSSRTPTSRRGGTPARGGRGRHDQSRAVHAHRRGPRRLTSFLGRHPQVEVPGPSRCRRHAWREP